ncbi:hypothetical protein [Nitrosopumilus adriaticus]|nr:hypothetical protein [Nitrosopumilus adriaticus]
MKYKIFSLAAIVAVVAVSGIFFANFENEKVSEQISTTEYIPSDMGQYFPDYEVTHSHASYGSIDMKDLKKDVKYSIQGTVVAISDILYWDGVNKDDEAFDNIDLQTIKVEVDVKVDKASKSDKTIKKGDIITITIQGFKSGDQISFTSDDQYQIGDEIIVHLGEDTSGIVGEDVKFSIAGGHTKYKIQNDKAYNDDNVKGKPIKEILDQSQ